MNELEKLRTLLVGPEQEVLDDLSRRVEEPDLRTGDVADVLPESVIKSHSHGHALARSLKDPVELCLKESFKEKPQEYADALYPIMGPAIRKSITETFRSLVQTINQAVEHSMTPRGLKWRIQAWRAGVPFGQYVIQQRLRYRVEQAYLIQKDTGLLIAEANDETAVVNRDTDAVSAMFTAIQDFVRDSFAPDDNSRLQTADMGEFTVWAIHGSYAVLACVIRGVPPVSLREDFQEILEHIHLNHGSVLVDFSGDKTEGLPIQDELSQCLIFENTSDGESEAPGADKKETSPFLWVLILGLVALMAYWILSTWVSGRQLSRLEQVLSGEPGIVLTKANLTNGGFVLEGMRDPLAREINEIISGVDIDPSRVDLRFESFQSLDGDILLRRLRQIFAEPHDLRFTLEDQVLVVDGKISGTERERLRTLAPALGIKRVDFLIDDDALREQLAAQLKPPRTVVVVVKDAIATVTGTAPLGWIKTAEASVKNISGLVSADLSAVRSAESIRFLALVEELNTAEFSFNTGVLLNRGETGRLLAYADKAAVLVGLADDLNKGVIFSLTGFTDSTGVSSKNRVLARRRAEIARDSLLRVSIPQNRIEIHSQTAETVYGDVRGQRKVVVRLELDDG